MKRLLLGISLLLFGCFNGRADATSDDIEGFVADDSKFAFFGFAFGDGADFDDNGTDDTISVAVITLTDSASLCDDLANISAAADPSLLGDHQRLNITAAKILLDNDDLGVDNDETIINDDLALSFVGVDFSAQQNGAEVASAGDNGDGVVNIKRISDGSLKADFSATLSFTDAGGNVVDVATSGDFVAKRCPALDSSAFIAGLFLGLLFP